MSLFDDTRTAFADRTDAQLKKAYWMFRAIEQPAVTNLGISVLNFSIKNNLPFVKGIVKNTLFQQFCGGETREESMQVVQQMHRRHVGSIFDYAIEGKADEKVFDATCAEIKENIKFAKGNPAIPFVVFKPTGFGRIDIYELVGKKVKLTAEQEAEWSRVVRRYEEVCQMAYDSDVVLMIDAEDSWMQDATDDLVNSMMEKYNREKAIVWNTIQMYRTGRMEYLRTDLQRANEKNYFLGYKFVRGAYMEKERERAAAQNYPDPIQPTKEATDKNFNDAVVFVLDHLDRISAFFGTHNEQSTQLVMDLMEQKGLPNEHSQIYFGQLYGMSDNITYALGAKNYNVCKYLPYGPVKDVIPYLTRRAQENTSVAGQTGRELSLIRKELKRRHVAKA